MLTRSTIRVLPRVSFRTFSTTSILRESELTTAVDSSGKEIVSGAPRNL